MAADSSIVFLTLVTLLINSTTKNDLNNYTPKYVDRSIFFFNNLSEPSAVPKPVEFDASFNGAIFFRKCCAPGSLYHIVNKECVIGNHSTSIYEELHVNVDLTRISLKICSTQPTMVIDRFVKRSELKRSDGDGSLKIGGIELVDAFCIDQVLENEEDYVIRICQPEDCDDPEEWCLPKCCDDGYGLVDYRCVLADRTGVHVRNNPHVYKNNDNYRVLYATKLNCENTYWKELEEVDIYVEANGSMFRKDYNNMEYKLHEYCMEVNYDTERQRLVDFVTFCEFRTAIYVKWALTKAAVVVACTCFVLTLIVYIFVYRLKKLVEKIVTCFCFMDFMFWLMYGLVSFRVPLAGHCTGFAYVHYFVAIARLSWLNVLSYDIWITIGSTRASVNQSKGYFRKQFLSYCCYAIAIPVIVTSIFIIHNRKVYSLPEKWVPRINKETCFVDIRSLDGNLGQLHLFIPVSVLIIINIVLFARTLSYFLKTKKELKKIADSTVANKDKATNDKKGLVILKLGLLMGITWIYYIYVYVTSFDDSEVLLIIRDILMFTNVFEGVYFFVILAVNWNTLKKIFGQGNFLKRCTSVTSLVTTLTDLPDRPSGMSMEP